MPCARAIQPTTAISSHFSVIAGSRDSQSPLVGRVPDLQCDRLAFLLARWPRRRARRKARRSHWRSGTRPTRGDWLSRDPAMTEKWDEMAVVGWIARAHGIRGQVIVKLETDFPEGRFRPGAKLFLNRAGAVEPLTVTTVRWQGERPVIGLHGVGDMNAANA